ncbi:MAG: hypothetical protein Salg2KO_21710 [Salibacteraceae bacterium]
MNDQQLQRYALVAEIVSGLAVLITLVVLIVEVNENTETMKASTYDSIIADIADFRMDIATNDYLSEAGLLSQTEGFESLSPLQLQRRKDTFITLFLHFERAFVHWKAGNLDDEAWARFHDSICRIPGPGFEEVVGTELDNLTTESFQQYRKSEC